MLPGFPDAEGPDSMKRVAGDALLKFPNQYAPLMGVQELRNAVATFAQVQTLNDCPLFPVIDIRLSDIFFLEKLNTAVSDALILRGQG